MPLFFFHLTGARSVEDSEGTPFRTVDQAIEHARIVADELARNRRAAANGEEITVVDESGREVFRIGLDGGSD